MARRATKRTARSRRTKREDEEPEEDEPEDGYEEEEPEEKPKKRRGVKRTSSKRSRGAREEEDYDEPEEDDGDFGSEVVDASDVRSLSSSEYDLPADGQWVVKVVKVSLTKPRLDGDNARMGGVRLEFALEEGPIDEPEEGFPPWYQNFVPPSDKVSPWPKGYKLSEKEKNITRYRRRDAGRFLTAVYGEEFPEGFSWLELYEDTVGTSLKVTATRNEGSNFQNVTNWTVVD